MRRVKDKKVQINVCCVGALLCVYVFWAWVFDGYTLVMKDYRLSGGNIGQFITELTKLVLVSKKTYRVNVVEWREKRSLTANAQLVLDVAG